MPPSSAGSDGSNLCVSITGYSSGSGRSGGKRAKTPRGATTPRRAPTPPPNARAPNLPTTNAPHSPRARTPNSGRQTRSAFAATPRSDGRDSGRNSPVRTLAPKAPTGGDSLDEVFLDARDVSARLRTPETQAPSEQAPSELAMELLAGGLSWRPEDYEEEESVAEWVAPTRQRPTTAPPDRGRQRRAAADDRTASSGYGPERQDDSAVGTPLALKYRGDRYTQTRTSFMQDVVEAINPTAVVAIPGYAGFIPGKDAGNTHGVTQGKGNRIASRFVNKARAVSDGPVTTEPRRPMVRTPPRGREVTKVPPGGAMDLEGFELAHHYSGGQVPPGRVRNYTDELLGLDRTGYEIGGDHKGHSRYAQGNDVPGYSGFVPGMRHIIAMSPSRAIKANFDPDNFDQFSVHDDAHQRKLTPRIFNPYWTNGGLAIS